MIDISSSIALSHATGKEGMYYAIVIPGSPDLVKLKDLPKPGPDTLRLYDKETRNIADFVKDEKSHTMIQVASYSYTTHPSLGLAGYKKDAPSDYARVSYGEFDHTFLNISDYMQIEKHGKIVPLKALEPNAIPDQKMPIIPSPKDTSLIPESGRSDRGSLRLIHAQTGVIETALETATPVTQTLQPAAKPQTMTVASQKPAGGTKPAFPPSL